MFVWNFTIYKSSRQAYLTDKTDTGNVAETGWWNYFFLSGCRDSCIKWKRAKGTACSNGVCTGNPIILTGPEDGKDFFIIFVAKYYLIQLEKENSFHSIKFSTDHGYAISLDMTVYSWKEDIENGKFIMQIEFRPIEYGKDYDIVHNPDKYVLFIDGTEIKWNI